MPNRILRDWTDSETIDTLTVNGERFFTRLIMKVDDYGRYNANVKFLKSTLFPLKTDVRESDISRWLAECNKSGLIVLYNISSKDYLQIENFKQTLRQKNEKYPAPTLNSKCVADDKQTNIICEHETNRNESETETEVEGQNLPKHSKEEIDLFKNFKEWVDKHAPRVNQLKEPITMDEYLKLRQVLKKDILSKLLSAMHNYKPLLTKNVSAYLTILNWSKREQNNDSTEQQTKISDEKARSILNS